MADKKISELTALTGANVATDDQLVIVDTSAALTKNITIDEFKNALDTATGFVRITGDTMTGDLALSGADVTFGDNDKAIFGAGSDLQIYHDGSNSYVEDTATGSLILKGADVVVKDSSNNDIAKFLNGGAAQLRYAGATKLATTSTGVDITGTLTSDGLTVDTNTLHVDATNNRVGIGTSSPGRLTELYGTSNPALRLNNGTDVADIGLASAAGALLTGSTSGALVLARSGANSINLGTNGQNRVTIDSSGNVGIGTSPSTVLHINDASDPILRLQRGGAAYSQFQSDSAGSLYISADAGNSGASSRMQFNVDGSEAMRIDSSGNVGIGTSSPSAYGAGYTTVGVNGSTMSGVEGFVNDTLTSYTQTYAAQTLVGTKTATPLVFVTNDTQRMRIDSSGNVGIGTSSVTSGFKLDVVGDARFSDVAGDDGVELGWSAGGSTGFVQVYDRGASAFRDLKLNNAVTIDSSGNVGIGTSSPAYKFVVSDAGNFGFEFGPNDGGLNRIYSYDRGTSAYKDFKLSASQIIFGYGSAGINEAMRIDSSGNLLVGTTDTTVYDNSTASSASNGHNIRADGKVDHARYTTSTTAPVLGLNRVGSDGYLAEFRKDGAVVGSIGVSNSNVTIGNGGAGIKFTGSINVLEPWTPSSNSASDGAIDIGYSGGRFKDLYLSGGVYLGGTGSANLLDDFEEGQFDVTISPATSGTISISTSYDKMRYTKVGNIVHIQGEIRVAAVSSPVGADVKINNLPFTSINGTDFAGRVGGATYYYQASSTSIQVKAFRVVESDDKIRFAIDASTVTANDEFAFNFTYTVA